MQHTTRFFVCLVLYRSALYSFVSAGPFNGFSNGQNRGTKYINLIQLEENELLNDPSRLVIDKTRDFILQRDKRREFEWESQANEPSPTTTEEHRSRVGAIASYFDGLLVGEDSRKDIDMAKLISACKKFISDTKRVGQAQGAKDLTNNVVKVEDLYRTAPVHCRHNMSSILTWEKSTGIHQPNAILKDPSGAVGLLWIRRNLSFQYQMYKYILEDNVMPQEAALKAYKLELEPFHGWPLQKVSSVAFKAMMPSDSRSMYAKLGGFEEGAISNEEEEATKLDLRLLLDTWHPLLLQWKQTYADLQLEDTRRA